MRRADAIARVLSELVVSLVLVAAIAMLFKAGLQPAKRALTAQDRLSYSLRHVPLDDLGNLARLK
jgi:hypothetical protein